MSQAQVHMYVLNKPIYSEKVKQQWTLVQTKPSTILHFVVWPFKNKLEHVDLSSWHDIVHKLISYAGTSTGWLFADSTWDASVTLEAIFTPLLHITRCAYRMVIMAQDNSELVVPTLPLTAMVMHN